MAYALSTSYMGESLLSGFNWFSGADPSNGYVSYQSRDQAESRGLVSIDGNTQAVRLGVDSYNYYPLSEGRPSIRLESKAAYNHGLFIADFLHMPPSDCGLWPAFWAYGTNWPNGGEIDIIEGANTAHKNLMSAHTAPGCSLDYYEVEQSSGLQRNTDCFVGDQNIGCGFEPPYSDVSSYGDSFNAVNGGVYAMDWNEDHIRVWHFPRGQIPSDITSKQPNPSAWGRPQASFGGRSCDVDSYFRDMSIVLNINFCGDYGNALWNSDRCNSYAPTCADYVGNNPEAFSNAYWEVNYIDVYEFQKAGNPVPPRPAPPGVDHSPFQDPGIGFEPAARNPAQIDRYAHLGCFESSSSFDTFEVAAEEDDMSLARCVERCGAKGCGYAGVNGRVCSCAHELDQETRAAPRGTSCSRPCPGKEGEFCGGSRSDDGSMASKHASKDGSGGDEHDKDGFKDGKDSKHKDDEHDKDFKHGKDDEHDKNSKHGKDGSKDDEHDKDGSKDDKHGKASKSGFKGDDETEDCLLTVYGAVLDNKPPIPPPMAPMAKHFMKEPYAVTDPAPKATQAALLPSLQAPRKSPPLPATPDLSRTPFGSAPEATPVPARKAATTLRPALTLPVDGPSATPAGSGGSSRASAMPISETAPKAPSKVGIFVALAVMVVALI